MKKTISTVVAIFLGISLVSVGVAAFVAPTLASEVFGIPIVDKSARAYMSAAGLRDITLGCLLFALVAGRAGIHVLGSCLMIFALIPIGDAILVFINAGGSKLLPLSLHISSAIVFILLGGWLRSGESRKKVSEKP